MEKMFLNLTDRPVPRSGYTATAIKAAYLAIKMNRCCVYKGISLYSRFSDWSYAKNFIKGRHPLSQTVAGILSRHKIKQADIPAFDDERVESFFAELYKAHPVACHKEALWQAVSDPTRVAYSQRKNDGRYTRVMTTLGKWLHRTTNLDDEEVKRLAERYKTLTTPVTDLVLQVCENGDDIVAIYEDNTICKSCMNDEDAVRVYDSPDISVVYAMYGGTVVGRAVCNSGTQEFVRAYPTAHGGLTFAEKTDTQWRELFLALLEKEGYLHNSGALEGLRLRFIDEDGDGRVAAPYIDGDYQAVLWEEGDSWMTVCSKGDDGSYACNNTAGWSDQQEDERITLRNGDSVDPDDAVWSNYYSEYLHVDDAVYSEYDGDYYDEEDTIVVLRYSSSGRHWEESVHYHNPTTEVIGFDSPVLNGELGQFLGDGYIVQADGEYYDSEHPDIVYCEWENCYALSSDCVEVNGELYTLAYIRDSADEFLVDNCEIAYHVDDNNAKGMRLSVACELGMKKAIESVYAVNYMPAMARYDGDALSRHLRTNVLPAKAKRLRQFLGSLNLGLLFDDLCHQAAENHPTLLAYREQQRNARARARAA